MHRFVSTGQHIDALYNNEDESAEGKEQSDLTGAAILTSKGGQTVRGKVVGRKRDHDGNPVVDPSNDVPLYLLLEYPDGSLSTEGYNALISALNLQLDEFGDEYYSFQEILGHQR